METDTTSQFSELDDQLALQKLINRYHWCADQFDWRAWADCFTPDAEFDFAAEFGTMCGRDQIHDICKGNMDHVYEAMQPVRVNLDFEITGADTAVGHGNLIFTAIPERARPEQNFQSGGRYNWEFARTADGWRIAKARLEFIWKRGDNVGDVFQASTPQAGASAG